MLALLIGAALLLPYPSFGQNNVQNNGQNGGQNSGQNGGQNNGGQKSGGQNNGGQNNGGPNNRFGNNVAHGAAAPPRDNGGGVPNQFQNNGGNMGSRRGDGGGNPNDGGQGDDGMKYPGVWSGLNGALNRNPGDQAFGGGQSEPPEPPPAPASIADARANFPALVGIYLSTGGGRKLRMKLLSIDPKSVAAARGRAVYTAKGKMRAQGIKDPVVLYFTADLSGTEWKIVSHSFTPPAAKPKPRKRKR